jgi:hypothetical protein
MATKAKTTKKTKTTPEKSKSKKQTTKVSAKIQKLPNAFDLFKPSANAVVLNIGVFLALLTIPILFVFLGGFLAGLLVLFAISTSSVEVVWMGVALFLAIFIVASVVGLIMAAALPYVQLRSIRGEKVGLSESIRAGRYYFWRFIGVSLAVGLVVMFGLILFIIPGIIFIRRYFLSVYFLVDKDIKVFESMKLSATATKGHSGAVWGVIGVNVLMGFVGLVPYLGGFASAALQAFYSCAPAIRYDQLKKFVK